MPKAKEKKTLTFTLFIRPSDRALLDALSYELRLSRADVIVYALELVKKKFEENGKTIEINRELPSL